MTWCSLQETERKLTTVRGVVRAVVNNQNSMMTKMEKMCKKLEVLEKQFSSPVSCEEYLPDDDTPPPMQQSRDIGGRRFPLNSHDEMTRFCHYWSRCEKDWEKKKKGKNYASDEEAQRALGKPVHKKLVGTAPLSVQDRIDNLIPSSIVHSIPSSIVH